MARTVAELPPGTRITDYISLGAIASRFPLDTVNSVLAAADKTCQRRALPSHVVVYYAIAMALFIQSSYCEILRCLLEAVQWPTGPETAIVVAGKPAISQARTRLGWKAMQQLHDQIVQPVAVKATKGVPMGLRPTKGDENSRCNRSLTVAAR